MEYGCCCYSASPSKGDFKNGVYILKVIVSMLNDEIDLFAWSHVTLEYAFQMHHLISMKRCHFSRNIEKEITNIESGKVDLS